MKMILIFDAEGDLIKPMHYKSKRIAKAQYNLFKKYGYLNCQTGEVIPGCTFELI